MTQVLKRSGQLDLDWLIALAAECLKLPEDEIDPRRALWWYGLDSVAAVQVAAAIAEKLGRNVPTDLLLDFPDLHSLARHMEDLRSDKPAAGRISTYVEPDWGRMRADSVLPADVCPATGDRVAAKTILLTGATGFLGAFLLQSLLRTTTARIYCLVRPGKLDPFERLRRNLESYGIWDPAQARRIHPVSGDLQQTHLGLDCGRFETLCRDVDEIYHCAAAVNWVAPYEGLHGTNVGGTLKLLRLACRHRSKPFHFISSLAVCHSTSAPAQISEVDDVLPLLEGLHLGYAQSKWVAEALVRQAAARGLPVVTHRPALICADSKSGISGTEDFLALLLKGCIRMGCAPEIDCVLDACPVDHVADAIAALSRAPAHYGSVFHLTNPSALRWTEVVLEMNRYGYSVPLLPYRAWLMCLEKEAEAPNHPLHHLKSFFLKTVTPDGLTLPEVHAKGRRACGTATSALLSALKLECPATGPELLDRYFDSFVSQGFSRV